MSNSISVSMHIGSGKNAINNMDKIKRADLHNNRKYKNNRNEEIDLSLSKYNITLVGTKNITTDIKEFYKTEFGEALYNYNKKQQREDRKIIDYLEKMNNDTKSNIAVEIIFQIGDKEDWENKSLEDKQKTVEIFKKAIPILQEKNIKCFNASLHLDETSPHLHLLAVPVIENQTRGLEKQVSQNKVITLKVLNDIRKEVEKAFIEEYNKIYGTNKELKKGCEITEHLQVQDYKDTKKILEVTKKVTDKQILKEKIEKDYNNITNELTKLEKEKEVKKQEIEKIKEDNEAVNKILSSNKETIDTLREELSNQYKDIRNLENQKDSNNSIMEMYKNNVAEAKEKIDSLKKLYNKLEDEKTEEIKKIEELKQQIEEQNRIRIGQENIIKQLEDSKTLREDRKKRLKELEEENTALQEKIKVVESNIKVYSNQLTKLETEEKELVSTVEIKQEQKDNKDKKKQLNKLLRILKNDDNITEETIYKIFKNLEIYNKETAIDFIEDIKRDNYITINNIDDETFKKIKNINDYYDDDFGFNKEEDDFEIGFKF